MDPVWVRKLAKCGNGREKSLGGIRGNCWSIPSKGSVTWGWQGVKTGRSSDHPSVLRHPSKDHEQQVRKRCFPVTSRNEHVFSSLITLRAHPAGTRNSAKIPCVSALRVAPRRPLDLTGSTCTWVGGLTSNVSGLPAAGTCPMASGSLDSDESFANSRGSFSLGGPHHLRCRRIRPTRNGVCIASYVPRPPHLPAPRSHRSGRPSVPRNDAAGVHREATALPSSPARPVCRR
jgi:hypothetical protein